MRNAPMTLWMVCLIAILPFAARLAAADAKPGEVKPAAKPAAAKPADAKAQPVKPAAVKAQPAKETKEKDAKAKAAKTAAKKPSKATVVRITLSGSYPEKAASDEIFGQQQTTLATLVARIDDAAADPSVAALWLRVENLAIGGGKVAELRAAIARFRKSHKPVAAELASADPRDYLVATACNTVIMAPSGVLLLPGVRAEMTFLKGLLDKVGVQADMLQQGRFKGAGEPLTRTTMSPALRESIEAVVGDAYDYLALTVAQDRKLQDYQVKTLMDQGLFTATAAKRAGLVDEVLYADQYEDALRKQLKVDELNVVSNYKKKQLDTDFSGISGLAKLMELMLGGKAAERGGAEKKIAVVYAVGPIVEGKGAGGLFASEAIGSSSLVSTLRAADDDAKVVAVVLRIDSPGGSAVASDLIWRQIVRMKKPVIASMSDVAGSGGYYIAMGAKKILAEPSTLTGSIGVIGGKLVTRDLMDKIGVTTEVVSRGKNSGAFSSRQPFTPSERQAVQAFMAETYGQFVSKAAEGRKMSRAALEKLAQGRIYTGRMAAQNGLVDRLGTLRDAVDEAKLAAGLKTADKVEIQVLPRAKSIFEQLFGDPSAATELDSLLPDVVKTAVQVTRLQKLLDRPAVLLMPCQIELK